MKKESLTSGEQEFISNKIHSSHLSFNVEPIISSQNISSLGYNLDRSNKLRIFLTKPNPFLLLLILFSLGNNKAMPQAKEAYVSHPICSGNIKQTIYDPFEQRLLILSQDGFREFKNGSIKKLELKQSYRRYLNCIPKKDTLLIFDSYFNITYCNRDMDIIKVIKFDNPRNHFFAWLNEYFIYSSVCPNNAISLSNNYFVSDGKKYLISDNKLYKLSEGKQLSFLGELPDILDDSNAMTLLRNSGLTHLSGYELKRKLARYKKQPYTPYKLGWLLYPNLLVYENQFIKFTDSSGEKNQPVLSQLDNVITSVTEVKSNGADLLFIGTTHGLQMYNFKEFITLITFDNSIHKKSNILFKGALIYKENKLLLNNGYLLNTLTNCAISFTDKIDSDCLKTIPGENIIVYSKQETNGTPTLDYVQWINGQCKKGKIPVSQNPISLFCLSKDSILYNSEGKLVLVSFKDRDQPIPKEKVIGTYDSWIRGIRKLRNSHFILSEKGVFELRNSINNKEPIDYLKDIGAQNIDTLNQEILLFSYGNGVYKIISEGKTNKLKFSNKLVGKFIHGIIHEEDHILLLTDYGLFYTSYSAFLKGMQEKSVIHIVQVDFVSPGKTIEFNSANPFTPLGDHRYAAMSQSGLVLIDMNRLNTQIFPKFLIKMDSNEFEVSETPEKINTNSYFLNLSLIQEHKLYSLRYPYSIQAEINGKKLTQNGMRENTIGIKLEEGKNKVLVHILDPILNKGYDKVFTIFTPIAWYNLPTVKFTLFVLAALIFIFILYTSYRYYRLRKVKGELNSFISSQFSLIESETKSLDMASLNFKRELTETELLLSSAVHDLATPLRFFRSITDHLKKHWSSLDEGTKKEQVDSLAYSAFQIKTLSDEFLLFIRNKVEKNFDYNSEPLSLRDEINRLASYYDWVKNIRDFKIEFSKTEDIIIEFDKEILAVVFRNLIDNVVKHSGTKLVHIKIIKSYNDSPVTLEINYESAYSDLTTINELNRMLSGDFQSGHVGLGFKLIHLALKISKTNMQFQLLEKEKVVILWNLTK